MTANRNRATTEATWIASSRKLAIAAGVLYLITHVTSVPGRLLYGPILTDAGYITGSGPDTAVLVGTFLEVICALAIVGTAVALYPVAKRQNEGIALGYVGLRTLEAGILAVGVVPLLAVVTLRQHMAAAAGADTASLVALGSGLVALNEWAFVVGPGFVCGANTVLMAYLLYRSRLVPRFIPVLGLVGGPLIFAYNAALLFGFKDQIPAWVAILVVPIFAWEVTLAVRLIVKGFNPSATTAESVGADVNESVERSLLHA